MALFGIAAWLRDKRTEDPSQVASHRPSTASKSSSAAVPTVLTSGACFPVTGIPVAYRSNMDDCSCVPQCRSLPSSPSLPLRQHQHHHHQWPPSAELRMRQLNNDIISEYNRVFAATFGPMSRADIEANASNVSTDGNAKGRDSKYSVCAAHGYCDHYASNSHSLGQQLHPVGNNKRAFCAENPLSPPTLQEQWLSSGSLPRPDSFFMLDSFHERDSRYRSGCTTQPCQLARSSQPSEDRPDLVETDDTMGPPRSSLLAKHVACMQIRAHRSAEQLHSGDRSENTTLERPSAGNAFSRACSCSPCRRSSILSTRSICTCPCTCSLPLVIARGVVAGDTRSSGVLVSRAIVVTPVTDTKSPVFGARVDSSFTSSMATSLTSSPVAGGRSVLALCCRSQS